MGVSQIFITVSFNRVFMQTVRKFSLSSASETNKYVNREAKFFNRLVYSSKPKRKLYFENSPVSPSIEKLNKKNASGPTSNKENSRRIAVLNTLFIKQISELLTTSSIAECVLNKGLQISRVAMAPNFNHLNVFWATNSAENAKALEAVLPDLGFALRHELSQLQVMGVVPRIVFVKDKQYDNALKIDHLLSIADFGEDHVPAPYGSEFINSPAIENKLMKDSAENTEDSNCGETGTEAETEEETMPVMRQDTFNLHHHLIMEKIMKSLKKSRAVHRFQPNLAVECEGTTNDLSSSTADTMSKQERKAALSRFILNRKILQEKRDQNKYNAELNVLPVGAIENDGENECEDFITEDYIEEDYFEEKKHNN